ncbi:MAG: HTTM domain-containing protein [Cytophagales bacterium]|nr:HTTM domain-containing protein [Cytophaga sp.]
MNYLSFDIRALSFMRILLACVILLDLCIRITDLEAFYSDTGAVPLSMLFQYDWNPYFVSLHTISGLWQIQLILFILSACCAFMMLIGYRTQLSTFLCWFLMLSLHNRNGLINQGGDDLLRMVLFWGIFIPWGARYSCDRLRDPFANISTTFISIATIAYLLQICYIYTGSALLKGPEWNTEYTALYYAYSLDQITMPIVQYIYYYPDLLKKLTFIAYHFELLIPILFFIPIKHIWFRMTGIVCIILFHLINETTLFIGLFPLIGMVTVIGLLPSVAMDQIEKYTERFKTLFASLFLKASNSIAVFIPWKKPVYELAPVLEKIQMACLIFLTVFVFDWNFSNLTFVKKKLSDNLRFIGYGLRLDQNWGMFGPGVLKYDGWYVHEGITADNDTINLLDPHQKELYNKPTSVVGMFRNDRWRKYSENMMFHTHTFMRGYYCNYVKTRWNKKHPEQPMKSLRIIYMQEVTLPDYTILEPKQVMLWECHE